MATDVQKLIGTSEEDDEEEMEMDVKEEEEEEEEEDDDDEDGERQISKHVIVGVDGRVFSNSAATARLQQHQPVLDQVGTPGGGARRSRPLEEKERTKLRERNRRAITARILAGLRRHGNYNLRVRADINDVIAALAREAGWVVLPDGTTFPSKSQGQRPNTVSSSGVNVSSQMTPQQTTPTCLKGSNSRYQGLADYNACQTKGAFVPNTSPYDLASNARSQSSSMMGDGGHLVDVHAHISGSLDEADGKQIVDIPSKLVEPDFSGSPYIPVYVMLPFGIINMKCELVDPDGLLKHLRVLKSAKVDGIIVDCWWGIVEAHTPLEYNWNGYRRLFLMVRELKLKLQVVMSFHECGGNVGDDVCIPLPHWVAEIGRSNPDIFFTDREGRHNPECLSWGVDRERVLRGRTALEVYFDYMKNFRMEFNEFFEDGDISMIEVGLGPRGELRYPSCPVRHGWRYPGIGEFQCYDRYLLKSLRKAADTRGHTFWARIPDNAGSYNSQPHETSFFCDGGDYDSYYGRFFLNWYSQVLVDHGDRVLYLAKLAFDGVCVAAKLSGIHWWYKTASHAAEITSGFYNSSNRDGYSSIITMLKTRGVALIFSSSELPMLDQHEDFPDALYDTDALAWQVMNAARDVCVPIISENAAPCFDRVGYNKILANAKPLNDPDGRHFFSFTYLRLNPNLMERKNFMEFERFVKRMHGKSLKRRHRLGASFCAILKKQK